MADEAEFQGFPIGTTRFLAELAEHNERSWFEAHRKDYEAYYVDAGRAFVAALGPRLQALWPAIQYDPRVNGSLFRINRDIRFSHDKSPYKTHLDCWFWSGEHRGWDAPGVFFRLTSDAVLLGCGMHRFGKDHLDRYRESVLDDVVGSELTAILTAIREATEYGIGGATRKRLPAGLESGHPRAELLKHDGLVASYESPITPAIHTSDFVDDCVDRVETMIPVAHWLAEYVVEI